MNKRKTAFPHMGNYASAFRALVEGCGGTALVPPPTTRRTIEMGSRHSPEFVCLPFKINLGNYIEALEQGAEILLQAGRAGPCRYGFYSEVQEQILRDLGYDFEMVHLFAGGRQFNTLEALKKVAPGLTPARAFKAAHLMFSRIRAIEEAEELARALRPFEKTAGTADRLLRDTVEAIDNSPVPARVRRTRRRTRHSFRQADRRDNPRPLAIGIVGELYLVMDARSNLEIERKLGRLGVRVVRPMSVSSLLRDAVLPFFSHRVSRYGREFSRNELGAHANHSIGHAVEFSRRGLDGVIHLYPFTCMPEVSARSILVNVSRRREIPILSLSFSEQTGEAGLDTRLESFVDMLERKRKPGK